MPVSSFSQFIASLDTDAQKRGQQFERFVKWFLKAEPEWSTQVEQVWLWDEYPQRWGRDCGIDLVFRHKNGEIWAVQAKCYAPDNAITKADINTFLSESSRDGIDKRLLIATTDKIAPNAKQVCDAPGTKPVVRYLLSHFESAEIEYPARLQDLAQAKRKPPPTPRNHQLEAMAAVKKGFKDADRGQLIMACGTGKTFTTLWIKEKLGAKQTLVLLPSLSLLSQTLREWTFAASTPFDVLCVCSDQTVGKKSEDEFIHSVADMAFPVTSDTDQIRRFLRGKGEKVIFSTYQSSPLVADAQQDKAVAEFDLVIADEAHRCAGKAGTDFSTVLDGNRIRATKRLFATATPRTYSAAVAKSAEDRGVEMVGMDDETVFGKVLHALPFGKAIADKLLTDYRVVIVGVDNPMIASRIGKRELLAVDQDNILDAEALAAHIGVLKAIKDYDLKRLISFHSRVKGAEDFAADIQNVNSWLTTEHKPDRTLWTDYVSGSMPTDKRRIRLEHLKAIKNNECGILSNARCLSEGVDVPTLDGVAFIDPRASQVDIIQAVGRAIRLSENKTLGTIVLPVFIEAGDTAEASIEASNFKPIWDVLCALKAHDDVLSLELDATRTAMGKNQVSRSDSGGFSKILIDLPAQVDASFADSLTTYLVERVTSSWSFWFGLLEAYVESEGHAQPPAIFKTADGFKLGFWVRNQRHRTDTLSPERRSRLEALKGWSWDPFLKRWDDSFNKLHDFVQREGHAQPSYTVKTADGFQLGIWVGTQRQTKDTLSPEQRSRLEALKGWSWDPLQERWDDGFNKLHDFVQREGHAQPSISFKTADGFNLGTWVGTQRQTKDTLSPERRSRLEALKDWSWDPLQERWDDGFNKLHDFVQREGHAQPSISFKTADGFRLGAWVSKQRQTKDSLSPERHSRLEDLKDWSWNPQPERWDDGFNKLHDFAQREGNAQPPDKFKTADGYKLGSWVSTQRIAKDALSPERRSRLEALLGWNWDPLAAQWEQGFNRLYDFVQREGHAQPPQLFKTADGYKLGIWVSTQRGAKDTLSPERRSRLEGLQGWSWDPISDQWEANFEQLQKFVQREGHARPPQNFKTADGYKLGSWVSTQRITKDTLLPERRSRLEALLGWNWDPLAAQWEEGFNRLYDFVQREGHAQPPQLFKTADGFALGRWVSKQRHAKNALPERRSRLEALPGWKW